MKKTTGLCLGGILLVLGTAQAAPPSTIPHQGRIIAGNTNYDGAADFKFLLFEDSDADQSSGNETALWANDSNSSVPMAEPAAAVTLTVNKGLYGLSLGDTSLTAALPNSIAPSEGHRLYLRVWFDGGSGVFEALSPDLEISPVAMALAVPGNGMGEGTTASGRAASAFGAQTQATGDFSTTFGARNSAPSGYEFVIGRNNTLYTPDSATDWDVDDRIFVIGNGLDTNNRSNLMTIFKSGQMDYQGNIEILGSVSVSSQYFYTTPEIYKLQIPASSFRMGTGNPDFDNGYIDFGALLGVTVTAPVHLPHGAVITDVVVSYYDNYVDENMAFQNFALRKRGYADTTATDITSFPASFGTTGNAGTDVIRYEIETGLSETVDQNTTYFLKGFISANGFSEDLRFYGVQITYTLSKVSH